MKTMKTLAAALMFTLFAAGMAQAQTKPANAIDEAGLKKMLEDLGYDIKPVKLSGERTGYYVGIKFKGFDADMLVQISPNGANIWGTLTLAELKSEHNAEGSRFIKLLQLNQKHGPSHFYVTPSGKHICLTRCLYVKGISNKELKALIEGLVSTAEQTTDDWDTNKWGTQANAPKTAPVPPEDMK